MKLRWVLSGLTLMVVLGGCATDERRARVQLTLRLMDDTTTLVKSLKEKITSATEQMVTERELNLGDAIKKCEEIKDFCKKQVQKQAEEIRTSRLGLSDAQKKEFEDEFRKQINDKMDALEKESLGVNAALAKLEAAFSKQDFKSPDNKWTEDAAVTRKNNAQRDLEELRKKIGEAQAEFETLNRKAQ